MSSKCRPFKELRGAIEHSTLRTWAQFTDRYTRLFKELSRRSDNQSYIDRLHLAWHIKKGR